MDFCRLATELITYHFEYYEEVTIVSVVSRSFKMWRAPGALIGGLACLRLLPAAAVVAVAAVAGGLLAPLRLPGGTVTPEALQVCDRREPS